MLRIAGTLAAPPGSIVVCDNLPAHKVACIRECLEAAGMGLLHLPPPALAGAGSTAPTSPSACLPTMLRIAGTLLAGYARSSRSSPS